MFWEPRFSSGVILPARASEGQGPPAAEGEGGLLKPPLFFLTSAPVGPVKPGGNGGGGVSPGGKGGSLAATRRHAARCSGVIAA